MPDGLFHPDDPGPFVLQTETSSWRVLPSLNRITPAGEAPMSVEPRVMQVLVALAAQAGTAVPREALLRTVWTDTVVNEEALTRAVSQLRKTFGESARAPEVIETIRGTGYRCIADVQRVEEDARAGNDARSAEASDADRPAPPDEGGSRRSVPPTALGALAALLVVLAGAVAWAAPWQSPSAAASPPALLDTQPFTTYPGEEREPAFSPDGSRVAFGWTGPEGDNVDLYLKQANTAEPLRLTDDPAFESMAAWSPDGTTLAFVRTANDTSALYTIPALGGVPRKLLDTQSPAYGLDWSPDGTALLFAERTAPDRPFRIVRLTLATRDTTALTQPPEASFGDLFPRWSPDGAAIAFSRRSRVSGHDLYLADADGSRVRALTEGELAIRGLDWSPDGAHLIYASYQSGTYGLWQVNVESRAVTWLPTRAERIYNPSVADRTGALVYEEVSYEKNVWQIDLDRPGRPALASRPIITSTRWDCEAYYSPQGDRLVFTSSRSGTLELWLSGPNGSNPVQLTDFRGPFVGNPRWSPDGDRVAFFATPEGRASVFVMEVPGGRPQKLDLPDDGGAPANNWVTSWSRDGDWLYVASDRSGTWQLWKVRPNGSDLTQVTASGGFAAHESVTGDTLFYSKPTTPGLWMRPTDSGPETQVVRDLALHDWGNWVVSATGLFFVRREADGTSIAHHTLRTGRTRTVTSIPNIATPSLDLSPDGRHLLYARVENVHRDLVTTDAGGR